MFEAQMFDITRKGDTNKLNKKLRNQYYDTWLTEEVYKKEILFKWADMMDDMGYKFFLACGSLLGAVRNHRLLPWDIDVDLMLVIGDCEMGNPEKDFDIFRIVREAHKRGFKRVRHDHYYSIDYYGGKDKEWCKYPELLKLPLDEQMEAFWKLEKEWFRDRFVVELRFSPQIKDVTYGAKTIDGWVCHYTNSAYRYFTTYSKVELYGRTFLAPGDVEYYLTKYGPKWKDVFCTWPLWCKYAKEIRKGIVPEEVRIFMEEFKARDKMHTSAQ